MTPGVAPTLQVLERFRLLMILLLPTLGRPKIQHHNTVVSTLSHDLGTTYNMYTCTKLMMLIFSLYISYDNYGTDLLRPLRWTS